MVRFACIIVRQLVRERFNLFMVLANAAVWAVFAAMLWALR